MVGGKVGGGRPVVSRVVSVLYHKYVVGAGFVCESNSFPALTQDTFS